MLRIALLTLLLAPPALAATDAELRVMNAVIDWHVEHARAFWEDEVGPDGQTMIGTGNRSNKRLVALDSFLRPRVGSGYLHEQRIPADEVKLERIRATPLFREYSRKRGGAVVHALRGRRDLLVVPAARIPGFKRTVEDIDPERFYERYPAARGLLLLSEPAISRRGDEALVYADLMMVFSQTGRLFYLKKRAGRWSIEWSVEMLLVPGC